jgi:chromosome segregation ATPase
MKRLRLAGAAVAVVLLLGAPQLGAQAQDSGKTNPALAAAIDKTNAAMLQLSMTQTQAQQVQDRINARITQLQGQPSSTALSQTDQIDLQTQLTQLQQQWTTVSSVPQALNSDYSEVATSMASNPDDVDSGASGATYDFNQMIAGLQQYTGQVDQAMQQVQEAGSGGNVNLGTVFQLQFRMQTMSQYIETVSNTLSAIHNEMITMARASQGQ